MDGWPKVERVLQAIDAIEALGVDPADVAPDYWRHVHNRLRAGEIAVAPIRRRAIEPGSSAGDRAMTRLGHVIATSIAALALGTPRPSTCRSQLIWNASASAPIGLYAVQPADDLEVSDLVAVAPPPELATFLAARGYLPKGVPLLKRVLALTGQTVCRDGLDVLVVRHRRSAAPASATALVASCRSGRAAAASPTANSSS